VRHSASGQLIRARLDALGLDELAHRARAAEAELYNQAIMFTAYSDGDAIDRILPFDVIPWIVTARDWGVIEAGVRQRVRAPNLLLADIYGAGKVLKDVVVPAELVLGNPNYRPEMRGLELPHGTYVHVDGTDLVHDRDGTFRMLEDNGPSPPGVSCVVENRYLMLRSLSDLVQDLPVRPVSDYGRQLHKKLSEVAPAGVSDPQVVLLSPGVFNSACFEHVFLAREMGVPLVEGRDLVVEDDRVHMRTVAGTVRADVIYRTGPHRVVRVERWFRVGRGTSRGVAGGAGRGCAAGHLAGAGTATSGARAGGSRARNGAGRRCGAGASSRSAPVLPAASRRSRR